MWHPNAIFVGADNYTSGVIGGKAAGAYAKKKWGCKDVWIFLGEHLEEGAAADLRLSGFADGVQEVCGKLPSGNIDREIMDAGTTDQAITKTTDWLTAHPQAKHVLATTIDDERATGREGPRREPSRRRRRRPRRDTVGIAAVKSGDVSKNDYLGCTAFFHNKYASYVMSVALDVLAGKPVPQEVHLQHKFLTHANIGQGHYHPAVRRLTAAACVRGNAARPHAQALRPGLGPRASTLDRRGRGRRADRRQRRRQVDARQDPLGRLPAVSGDDRARRAPGALLDARSTRARPGSR